jgi:hypothetical protein
MINQMIETLSNERPSYAKNYDNYKHGDFVQYSGRSCVADYTF